MYIRFATIGFLFAIALAGRMARCEPPAERKGNAARKDRFGDPLPAGARARLGTTRLRHNAINSLAVSPDGKLLVTAGLMEGAYIRVWDLATGRLIRQRDQHRWAHLVAFSPDGKLFASGGVGGEVYIWRTATGYPVHRLPGESTNTLFSLAFSPDGKTLAAGGRDIALWDVAEGKLRRRIAREGNSVEGLAFSPDGKFLAAEDSQILTLWDTATGRKARRLEGKMNVPCLAFTPDGKFLAAGGWQDDVGLWEVATGKRVRLFKGHKESVASLAISPDGKILATGGGLRGSVRTNGSDHTVRLWDIATGRTLHVLPAGRETVFDLAFTPDGKTLITGSEMVRLWDVATGERRLAFASHEYKVAGVAFLPEGKVRTVSLDGTFRTWEAATGGEAHRLTLPSSVKSNAVSLSANGQRIACVDSEGAVHVVDAETGHNVRCWPGKYPNVASAVSLSPDGSLLAVSGMTGRNIRLCRISTGDTIQEWRDNGTHDGTNRPIFSPDGRYMAWANRIVPRLKGYDEEVLVFDVAEGTRFHQIRLDRPASALAFSPDGRTLLIGEDSARQIRGWEVVSGQPRWVIKPPNKFYDASLEAGPMRLQFAPDGRLLAIGGGTAVQLWDTLHQKRVHILWGHQDHLADLAFSPDGRLLASASCDSSAVIWEVPAMKKEKQPVSRLKDAELASLWSDLGGAEAAKAFQSLHVLAEHPSQALAFVGEWVRPTASPDPQDLKHLITDLESERFEVREKAQKELERLGPLAGPALRKTLSSRPLLETRRRVEALLERLKQRTLSAKQLRQIRTTELLEQIGSEDARRLLEKLAKGAPEAWLTQEAKASHQRMSRRPISTPERK